METLLKKTSALNSIKKPRVGFAGVGWIGRSRMETIIATDMVDAVAIAEPVQDMLDESRKLAPGAKCFKNFEQLLDYDLDAIVIATPNYLHKDQAIAALTNGTAVFCQKPLALNSQQTNEIVNTARRVNCLLGVDFSYRSVCAVQALHDCIERGEIGNIYAVDLVFHNAYGPGKSWFYDVSQSGGGCVIDLGIHLIDLGIWMLGFPEVTSCRSTLFAKSKLAGRNDVEDHAIVQFMTDAGVSINLACSWNLSIGCGAMISATFYGTDGTAVWQNVNGSFFDFEAAKFNGPNKQIMCNGQDNWFGKAAVNWIHKLVKDKTFDAEIENVSRTAKLIDMIYKNYTTAYSKKRATSDE